MNENAKLKAISYIRKHFMRNKVCKLAFLVVVGPFVTPDMLNSHSLVRRFSTYITPPVAASGFFSIAFAACLRNFAANMGILDGLPGAKYYEIMEAISLSGHLFGGAIALLLIYSFSIAAQCYHRVICRALMVFSIDVRGDLFRYFILKASYGCFVVGVICYVLSYFFPAIQTGNFADVSGFISDNRILSLLTVTVVAVHRELTAAVRDISDIQIYGSSRIALIVNVFNVILLIAIIKGISVLSGAY